MISSSRLSYSYPNLKTYHFLLSFSYVLMNQIWMNEVIKQKLINMYTLTFFLDKIHLSLAIFNFYRTYHLHKHYKIFGIALIRKETFYTGLWSHVGHILRIYPLQLQMPYSSWIYHNLYETYCYNCKRSEYRKVYFIPIYLN